MPEARLRAARMDVSVGRANIGGEAGSAGGGKRLCAQRRAAADFPRPPYGRHNSIQRA